MTDIPHPITERLLAEMDEMLKKVSEAGVLTDPDDKFGLLGEMFVAGMQATARAVTALEHENLKLRGVLERVDSLPLPPDLLGGTGTGAS
ncbi:hypothetical protein [Isoptericola sp. NPDC058082]|uniref:hypothetical protein n=1 Tax=Isoptericola sp. NPDC058082 TaxID=3346331 RepID=UPI0036E763A7